MGYILLALIIYIIIAVATASKFSSIAEEKGHSGYFGWCFWLGAIGWMMVVALPDRGRPIQVVQEVKREPQSPAKEQQPKTEDRLPEL